MNRSSDAQTRATRDAASAAAFGVVLALGCGLALSLWHTIREGPPPNGVVPAVITILGAVGVLAGSFGRLVPRRLLRPPS